MDPRNNIPAKRRREASPTEGQPKKSSRSISRDDHAFGAINRERSESSSRRSSTSNPSTRQSPAGRPSLPGAANGNTRGPPRLTAPSAETPSPIDIIVEALTQAISDTSSARVLRDLAQQRSDHANREYVSLKNNFSDWPALAEQKLRVKQRTDKELNEAASSLRQREVELHSAVTKIVSSAASPKRDEPITPSIEAPQGYVSRSDHNDLMAEFKRMQGQLEIMQNRIQKLDGGLMALKRHTEDDHDVAQGRFKTLDGNIASAPKVGDLTKIQTHIGELDRQIKDHGQKVTLVFPALKTETGRLAQQLTSLEQNRLPNLSRQVQEQNSTIQKLREAMPKLQKPNDNAAIEKQVSALNMKVGAYDKKMLTIEETTFALENRISNVQQEKPNGVGNAALEKQVSALNLKFGACDKKISTIEEVTSTLDQRLSTIEHEKLPVIFGSLGELRHVPTRLSTIEAKVPKVEVVAADVPRRVSSIEGDHQQNAGTARVPDTQSIETFTEEVKNLRFEIEEAGIFALKRDEAVGEDMDNFKKEMKKEINSVRVSTSSLYAEVKDLRHDFHALHQNTMGVGREVSDLRKDVHVLHQHTKGNAKGGQVDLKLRDQVNALSYALGTLETRFSNLTTDDLASRMVRQMHEIYPTAKIVADVERLERSQKQAAIFLQSASREIEEMSGRIIGNDAKLREDLGISVGGVQVELRLLRGETSALQKAVKAINDDAKQKSVETETERALVKAELKSLHGNTSALQQDVNRKSEKTETAINNLVARHSTVDKNIKDCYDSLGAVEAEIVFHAQQLGNPVPVFGHK